MRTASPRAPRTGGTGRRPDDGPAPRAGWSRGSRAPRPARRRDRRRRGAPWPGSAARSHTGESGRVPRGRAGWRRARARPCGRRRPGARRPGSRDRGQPLFVASDRARPVALSSVATAGRRLEAPASWSQCNTRGARGVTILRASGAHRELIQGREDPAGRNVEARAGSGRSPGRGRTGPAVARLLVATQRLDDRRGRCAEARSPAGRPRGAARPAAPGGRGGDAQALGQPGLGHDAEGDRLAVGPAVEAGRGLERVADGVAVVQDVAQLGLLLVALDDLRLDPAGAGDDPLERRQVAREQGRDALLEVLEVAPRRARCRA